MNLSETLERYGQSHVLRYFDQLTGEEQEEFSRSLAAIDFGLLSRIKDEPRAEAEEVCPIQTLNLSEIARRRAEFYEAGLKILREGKVCAVMLAGGQGTRLGFHAPKGMYDIGVTRPVYLFELLIRNLLSVAKESGTYPPLFIMTSELNDAVTRSFFKMHACFGYPEERVGFFVQKMSPCVDLSGKLLLEGKGRLARSPDGNGGWFGALKDSGLLNAFGPFEWFNVFSVDNVLQKIADPVFLGATQLLGYDCAAKGVKKRDPFEKVGVLCKKNGLPAVIEYYELDEARALERGEDGELAYSFGVTLNYLFRAQKLMQIPYTAIPVHVVKKKIPCLGEDGTLLSPESDNGFKFETLILDLVQKMGNCLPFEVVREQEFAPVKNREGADSVETARRLLLQNGFEL